MVIERHVTAGALARLGAFLAGHLGVELSIQIVVFFRVTAILAVLRKLSHSLPSPSDGCSFPTVLSSVRFGQHRRQGLWPWGGAD
jgi:hypothetical protein